MGRQGADWRRFIIVAVAVHGLIVITTFPVELDILHKFYEIPASIAEANLGVD